MTKLDLFVGTLMTAHELMMNKGRVMESGTIVTEDGTTFSYKLKTLKIDGKNLPKKPVKQDPVWRKGVCPNCKKKYEGWCARCGHRQKTWNNAFDRQNKLGKYAK